MGDPGDQGWVAGASVTSLPLHFQMSDIISINGVPYVPRPESAVTVPVFDEDDTDILAIDGVPFAQACFVVPQAQQDVSDTESEDHMDGVDEAEEAEICMQCGTEICSLGWWLLLSCGCMSHAHFACVKQPAVGSMVTVFCAECGGVVTVETFKTY